MHENWFKEEDSPSQAMQQGSGKVPSKPVMLEFAVEHNANRIWIQMRGFSTTPVDVFNSCNTR